MGNGRFRIVDKTLSTVDWINLNFDSIPTEAVQHIIGENYESLERVNPEKCEECGGKGCEACDGSGINQEEYLHGWPAAWGTMWQVEDSDEMREALDNAGFIVYSPDYNDTGFDCLLFGVDGAGYDFYTSHWIPLRAHLVIDVFKDQLGADIAARRNKILTALEKEADSKVVSGGKNFLMRFGQFYSKRRWARARNAESNR